MNFAALRIDPMPRCVEIPLPRNPIYQPANHNSKSLHVVHSVPASPRKHEAEPVEMRAERVHQSRVGTIERIPSREAVKGAIKSAFTEVLPQYRITAQEIADRIGAKDATVEGWRTKPGLMSAEYLVILMIAFPQFGSAVRRRLQLRPEIAPTLRAVLDEVEDRLAGGII